MVVIQSGNVSSSISHSQLPNSAQTYGKYTVRGRFHNLTYHRHLHLLIGQKEKVIWMEPFATGMVPVILWYLGQAPWSSQAMEFKGLQGGNDSALDRCDRLVIRATGNCPCELVVSRLTSVEFTSCVGIQGPVRVLCLSTFKFDIAQHLDLIIRRRPDLGRKLVIRATGNGSCKLVVFKLELSAVRNLCKNSWD